MNAFPNRDIIERYSVEEVSSMNLDSEDLNKMEQPVNEAKDILLDEQKNEEEPFEISVERGTDEDIFYKTLIKEANISVKYEDNLQELDINEDQIIIQNLEDKRLVKKLLANPVVNFLIKRGGEDYIQGKALEKQGLLEKNDTERILLRFYQKIVDNYNEIIASLDPGAKQDAFLRGISQTRIAIDALNNKGKVTPMTDEEYENRIKSIIKKEIKNK